MEQQQRCPVCGKDLTNEVPGIHSKYKMHNYMLCGKACKQRFDRAPEEFAGKQSSAERSVKK